MDPEGIATGITPGPTLAQQVPFRDHAFAGGQQPPGQPLVDRGQLDPRPAKQQPAVIVDNRGRLLVRPPAQAAQPGANIAFVARQADPILENVPRLRGIGRWGDQQEAGDTLLRQTSDFVALLGPVDDDDVSHLEPRRPGPIG
ncbi:MAG: hypothetical protein QOG44_2085 [Acidimicrobiaceae bacterium]|nr:hypothetical protein [Acidimicrobiaceae bacterium]